MPEFIWTFPCHTPAIAALQSPQPETFTSNDLQGRGILVFTDEDQLHRFFDRTQKQGEILSAITHRSHQHLIAFLLQVAQNSHRPVTHVLVDPSSAKLAVWRPIPDVILEIQSQE